MTPAPNLTVAALVQTALAKCGPKPFHVADLSSVECCGLCLGTRHRERDVARWLVWEMGEDETPTMVCAGCVKDVCAALDSFSRWAERTYEEVTDRDYCGGACLNCQERARENDLVTYREFSTCSWYSALRTAEVLRRDGYDASHGGHGTHFVITNASEAEFQNAYAHVIGDAS